MYLFNNFKKYNYKKGTSKIYRWGRVDFSGKMINTMPSCLIQTLEDSNSIFGGQWPLNAYLTIF